MRYMRWSFTALMECPTDYLKVIAEQAEHESKAAQGAGRKRR